jgi:hypothetical protein
MARCSATLSALTLLSIRASRVKLRLAITFIIALMIISSPILVFVDPAPGSAVASSDPTTITTPSTISQGGSDFTTQATVCCLTARPTNNIVNTNSFYDIVFLTASTGVIKSIQVTFPAGTTIPSGAFFNEADGIGPGTVSKSGQTITYTVNNAVNVPAGTKIRLEFANINNPLNPSANYKITVTTRNAANAIIDGPTQSTAYTIKQIGVNAIADGHITSSKPSEGLMKKVTLRDTAAGNARGWNPDGAITNFQIIEPLASNSGSSAIINVEDPVVADPLCNAGQVFGGVISVVCATAPTDGSDLDYTIMNLPPNVVS